MPLLRWIFTNRQTGRVTIAQWPNASLWVWIVSTLLPVQSRFVDDAGTAGLGVWAALEVWSGVNPWRRALGVLGLASVVRSLT